MVAIKILQLIIGASLFIGVLNMRSETGVKVNSIYSLYMLCIIRLTGFYLIMLTLLEQ